MTHCTNFKECTDEIIYLDLDKIFNETEYQNNICVKNIILFRTKTTSIKIGDGFLADCTSLTTINLSPLQNVTSVGNCFCQIVKV